MSLNFFSDQKVDEKESMTKPPVGLLALFFGRESENSWASKNEALRSPF